MKFKSSSLITFIRKYIYFVYKIKIYINLSNPRDTNQRNHHKCLTEQQNRIKMHELKAKISQEVKIHAKTNKGGNPI